MRNLQRTGGTSFSITVPKQWVEDQKLKDKDQIIIDLDPFGNLTIKPFNTTTQISVSTLHVDNYQPSWITRELISLYLRGTEEFIITSKRLSPEQKLKIRETTQLLLGLEIIDESASTIHIKNIFDSSKFPIAQSIEKMFLITEAMFMDAAEAVIHNDKLLASDVISRDGEIDKLNLVINRQFHSVLMRKLTEEEIGITLMRSNYYAYIANQIERIADHAAKIATLVKLQSLKNISTQTTNSLQHLTQHSSEILTKTKSMVKAFDKIIAHNLLDMPIDIFNKSEYKAIRMEMPIVLDSFDRIYRYIENIAEITIDYAIVA